MIALCVFRIHPKFWSLAVLDGLRLSLDANSLFLDELHLPKVVRTNITLTKLFDKVERIFRQFGEGGDEQMQRAEPRLRSSFKKRASAAKYNTQ